MTNLEVIHEDNHVLAVIKPAGMLVQADHTGDVSAIDLARSYLRKKYEKPGRVFLGLVHRIDRPVSGIVVFARTSKAASRLTAAFRVRSVRRRYLAVVHGSPPRQRDTVRGFIARDGTASRFVFQSDPGAREVQLEYSVIERAGGFTLVEAEPVSGRHHQIRLQLSGEGCPVAGDVRYGAPGPLSDRTIALHAARLRIPHPTRGETIDLAASPPLRGPWKRFAAPLSDYFARAR